MRKKIVPFVFAAVFMLAVMVAIFVFSGQNGTASSTGSNKVGSFVLELLHIEIPAGVRPDAVPILFGFTIRNLAHIFLYFLLGISTFLFSLSLMKMLGRSASSVGAAGFALLISLFYACTDELHQMFVSGRSASVRDVGIDAIGFTLAIVLAAVTYACVGAVARRAKK